MQVSLLTIRAFSTYLTTFCSYFAVTVKRIKRPLDTESDINFTTFYRRSQLVDLVCRKRGLMNSMLITPFSSVCELRFMKRLPTHQQNVDMNKESPWSCYKVDFSPIFGILFCPLREHKLSLHCLQKEEMFSINFAQEITSPVKYSHISSTRSTYPLQISYGVCLL